MLEANTIKLPKGWEWTTLEKCADVLDSQRIPVNNEERNKRLGDIPYYGATGQVGWINNFLFNEELLLLGEDGAPFFERGKAKAYIINGKSWVNNHAHVLRAIADITSNQLLNYYLNVFDYHEYVNGTTRLKLTQGAMNRIPMPLPPLTEQTRIVTKVEKLLGQVNKTREELAKIPLLLKKFRQSVLAKAFSGELTKQDPKDEPASVLLERIKAERKKLLGKKYKELEPIDAADLPDLPKGWEWASIEQISLLNPKHSSNIISINKPVSFVPMPAVDAELGVITAPETKPYGEVSKGFTHFVNGDVLFAKITPCMENGKAAVAKDLLSGIGCGSTEFHVIRSLDKMLPEYIYYYIRQKSFRNKARDNMTGTVGQARVPTEFIKTEVIPIPPVAEQKRIVEKIENYFTQADEIAKAIEIAQKHCDRMTQAILAKAFRGELVPQNPSDEPASVLLERIKKEKNNNKNN